MTRFLLSFVVLIFCYTISFGQVVDEGLRDGTLPAGWSQSDIVFETASGGYARFRFTSSTLTTLPFSVGSGATLTFNVAKTGSGGDGPLIVEISNDGGSTFTASFTSPTPTDANYLPALWTLPIFGPNVVLRFNRTASPSGKRLRDVVVVDNNPLPVTLTTFNAKPTASGAMLEWTTASEENNDYFAVEMSRDAASFSESAQVKGNGTTESLANYSYEFSNLAAGTYYFRLRQVDYDGQFSFSDVVSLEVAGRDFKMFTSVVHETLQIDAEDPRPVRVLNMAGAVVAEFDLKAGRNNLNVSNLVGGMYILSDGINAQRFVK